MDRREYFEQTGFIQLPQPKIYSESNEHKSFGIPSMLFEILIKYPSISFEELIDEITDKYGIEKANYILKKMSGGLYDLDKLSSDTHKKTR